MSLTSLCPFTHPMRMEEEDAKNQTLKQGREWHQASVSMAQKCHQAHGNARKQLGYMCNKAISLISRAPLVAGTGQTSIERWVAVNRLRYSARHHGQVLLRIYR